MGKVAMESEPLRKFSYGTVLAAIAMASFTGTATFFALFNLEVTEAAFVLGIPSAILSPLLAITALRLGSTRTRAALGCLLLSPAFAVVAAVVSSAFVVVFFGAGEFVWWQLLGQALLASFCSIWAAVPCWLLMSGLTALLIGAVHPLHRHPARDVNDLTLKWSGVWLSGTTAPAILLLLLLSPKESLIDSGTLPVFVVAAAVVVFGLVVVGVAEVKLRSRRRWLARVERGEVEGWKVVPRDELSYDVSDVPPLFRWKEECTSVVVGTNQHLAGGAYRSEQGLEPWALV